MLWRLPGRTGGLFMDSFNSNSAGGSLQISIDVIEKIAHQAAVEVEGVAGVAQPSSIQQNLLGKLMPNRPIQVAIKNDVADIAVALAVYYGTKIPEVSEQVQASVKDAVQSMTNISVAKVDIVVTGLVANVAAQDVVAQP